LVLANEREQDMIEFWRSGSGYVTPEAAMAAEAEGWDGQTFQDSLSLCPSPYVLMGAAAMVTEKIRLATGVTNPLTRHIALTAAGAAGVQAVSGGRAVLGIGRGGLAPVPLVAFGRALRDLQSLLSGARVEAPLFHRATGLEWLPQDLPKVPLDVAASGPKVIEMAAPVAERLTFSLGAIPERIEWAVSLARTARTRAGLPPGDISLGAQVIVACHADIGKALEFAEMATPALMRFQLIQGLPAGELEADDARAFEALRQTLERAKGGAPASSIGRSGPSLDFVRRFAIVGPPEVCFDRLLQLEEAGVERFVVVCPGRPLEDPDRASNLFATEVMPALRAAAASRDAYSPKRSWAGRR
jgi:5,10-methylenetetrahydromethanopterin reductase